MPVNPPKDEPRCASSTRSPESWPCRQLGLRRGRGWPWTWRRSTPCSASLTPMAAAAQGVSMNALGAFPPRGEAPTPVGGEECCLVARRDGRRRGLRGSHDPAERQARAGRFSVENVRDSGRKPCNTVGKDYLIPPLGGDTHQVGSGKLFAEPESTPPRLFSQKLTMRLTQISDPRAVYGEQSPTKAGNTVIFNFHTK